MKSKENNYAFVDSQNLNLSVQSLGWRLDFAKFRVYLSARIPRRLCRGDEWLPVA